MNVHPAIDHPQIFLVVDHQNVVVLDLDQMNVHPAVDHHLV
jgi:hypothetical protein